MTELVTATVYAWDGHDAYSYAVGDLEWDETASESVPLTKERAIELATRDALDRFEENVGNKGLVQRIIIMVELPPVPAVEPATVEVL